MDMKRIPKQRIIYDNYDLWKTYTDEDMREELLDQGYEEEEITDNMIMEKRYFYNECDWDDAKRELDEFFKSKTVGFFGEVGLWDGVHKAGKIGEFWDLFYKAIEDCDYVRIYDENGHLYLTCSHHDGTCHFEIKEISQKGYDYLDRWEYNWNDKRNERAVHGQIYKRYSKLPRFAEKIYGCKARDYEPQSKKGFIRQLNNQASSRYSA